MAHTDRHRPWHVQVADPYEQAWYWHYRGLRFGWTKVSLYRFGCPDKNCSCRWPGWKPARADRRMRRHIEQRRLRAALKGDWNVWDHR